MLPAKGFISKKEKDFERNQNHIYHKYVKICLKTKNNQFLFNKKPFKKRVNKDIQRIEP